MKKLIVLSVVFALVATAAFAVDVGAGVQAKASVIKGDTGKTGDDANPIESSGEMGRARFDGYGEVADGKFGGYIRLDAGDLSTTYAFWKPIDQFKLLIGGNSDGFYGKQGATAGWGFHGNPYDGGVAFGGSNIWGWGPDGSANNSWGIPVIFNDAFFGGYGANALHLNITPIDILGINIAIPVFQNRKTEDIFKQTVAQVDLKLDFGNIALTYVGGLGYVKESDDNDPGSVFLFYGGTFGDLSIDFGFKYQFATHDSLKDEDVASPMGVGFGVKYATDAFGVKFRAVAKLGMAEKQKDTFIMTEVVPYFPLGDNLAAFVGVGLVMCMPDTDGDKDAENITGWYFNPYLRIGEEWGGQFLVGVIVSSNGIKGKDSAGKDIDPIIKWSIPIAILLNF